MTREGLSDFLRAVERNASLRKELKQCADNDAFLKIANAYGFKVALNDLQEEEDADRLENWFKVSKINPIRKPYT